MHVFLIHGMGRTPLSMWPLRNRVRSWGYRVHLIGYSASFESLAAVTERLAARVERSCGEEPYALVGHSLGSVIIRNALPRLASHPPRACFFLAPPMGACRAAKFFRGNPLYRLLMGEMGQLLADEAFMQSLAIPERLRIYAGTGGPRFRKDASDTEPSDGILALSEASGAQVDETVTVPAIHTFIMNDKRVAADLKKMLDACS
ncbi:MAG: esterase/lipase family protein [Gammaproteobacteria bacterium]